jgi:hypothetical protein
MSLLDICLLGTKYRWRTLLLICSGKSRRSKKCNAIVKRNTIQRHGDRHDRGRRLTHWLSGCDKSILACVWADNTRCSWIMGSRLGVTPPRLQDSRPPLHHCRPSDSPRLSSHSLRWLTSSVRHVKSSHEYSHERMRYMGKVVCVS